MRCLESLAEFSSFHFKKLVVAYKPKIWRKILLTVASLKRGTVRKMVVAFVPGLFWYIIIYIYS